MGRKTWIKCAQIWVEENTERNTSSNISSIEDTEKINIWFECLNFICWILWFLVWLNAWHYRDCDPIRSDPNQNDSIRSDPIKISCVNSSSTNKSHFNQIRIVRIFTQNMTFILILLISFYFRIQTQPILIEYYYTGIGIVN